MSPSSLPRFKTQRLGALERVCQCLFQIMDPILQTLDLAFGRSITAVSSPSLQPHVNRPSATVEYTHSLHSRAHSAHGAPPKIQHNTHTAPTTTLALSRSTLFTGPTDVAPRCRPDTPLYPTRGRRARRSAPETTTGPALTSIVVHILGILDIDLHAAIS